MEGRVVTLYCYLGLFLVHYYSCMQCPEAVIAFNFSEGRLADNILPSSHAFSWRRLPCFPPPGDSSVCFLLKFHRSNLKDFFSWWRSVPLMIHWLIDPVQWAKSAQNYPDGISTSGNVNGIMQAYLVLIRCLTNPLLYLSFLLNSFLWLQACVLTH